MRVIAGTARSIPLITPEGLDTRPTTDKIKETLFNMLQFQIQDCVFVDLFGGSGAIAIEALSRGAERAFISDNSSRAYACIMANLKKCRLESKAAVLKCDALAAVSRFETLIDRDREIIVFLDPPYGKGMEFPVLKKLMEAGIPGEHGTVILETSLDGDASEAEQYGYEIFREKKYKNQKHLFLRRKVI